ncbi:DUF433 domain-containing protein [Tychonema sp. LEGE 06208]|uniref:DUF433 domain-containing protein n=1 Tax=Tychonema sp. LEGE 06208 TaxID=1828663 RepID=UPI001880BAC0|nr:DUF433 domain-containing protein [Tychonema sp. LEGE 06208]MBE9161480.1 DUF433 domain-containing protein [Tychonema sp. LEGE 06208]
MTLTSRVIHSDPDILGGTPVFVGTRVPMKTLLDYLEAGDSLDVFLDHFPSVTREQTIAALELAKEMRFLKVFRRRSTTTPARDRTDVMC